MELERPVSANRMLLLAGLGYAVKTAGDAATARILRPPRNRSPLRLPIQKPEASHVPQGIHSQEG
jgi:hypothetical protein